jgi:hypothetical protein
MKKLNNKILLIVLVAMVGVFALSRLFRSPKLEANMRKELITLDTAKVTEVRIAASAASDKEMKLLKSGTQWWVSRGNKKYTAEAATIKSMLASVASLQAQRMVSRKKDKWETFNVGEKGTHVSIWNGGNRMADFYVGKTGFNQSPGGYQGGFAGAYTYVRLADETEVYSVDGFLESTFNRAADDFRDRSFLRVKTEDINKITFAYPADSSFVLEKRESVWHVGNVRADSAAVAGYLNQWSFKNLSAFADDFNAASSPTLTIKVEGQAGVLTTLEGWKQDNGEWALRSSLQKDVVFSSASSSIVNDVLVNSKKFIPAN